MRHLDDLKKQLIEDETLFVKECFKVRDKYAVKQSIDWIHKIKKARTFEDVKYLQVAYFFD